jgi:hypothetical protein
MQRITDFKPWEEYPEIWKTEAAWWAYLRGALRRGLWERSPIKLSYKNSVCTKPPEGYKGKAKTGSHCALTGEWTGKSKLDVDHIEGYVSLLSWEDVLPFILHLVPPRGSLQLVERDAHKIKSYAERMNISFEQAVIEKRIIELTKLPVKELQELLAKHNKPSNNASVRKQSVRELVEEGKV